MTLDITGLTETAPTDKVDVAWRRYREAEAALRPLERDLVTALLARVSATVRAAYPGADRIETVYCTATLARVGTRGRYVRADDEVVAAVASDLTLLSQFHVLPYDVPLALPAAPPEAGAS